MLRRLDVGVPAVVCEEFQRALASQVEEARFRDTRPVSASFSGQARDRKRREQQRLAEEETREATEGSGLAWITRVAASTGGESTAGD